jgi:hypothetical protein
VVELVDYAAVVVIITQFIRCYDQTVRQYEMIFQNSSVTMTTMYYLTVVVPRQFGISLLALPHFVVYEV